jgi:hypothetical protein
MLTASWLGSNAVKGFWALWDNVYDSVLSTFDSPSLLTGSLLLCVVNKEGKTSQGNSLRIILKKICMPCAVNSE